MPASLDASGNARQGDERVGLRKAYGLPDKQDTLRRTVPTPPPPTQCALRFWTRRCRGTCRGGERSNAPNRVRQATGKRSEAAHQATREDRLRRPTRGRPLGAGAQRLGGL